MSISWQFEFPSEVQAEREPALAALHRAMKEAVAEACLEAQKDRDERKEWKREKVRRAKAKAAPG